GELSDISKVNEGFATITPIKLDMTSYESLAALQGKF
ncbi:MAG: 5'/3'-nucleotidase SurE, partial [Campylobacter concisus]|nr:5'/3'-nucleotidase SurE [Campylobacter concisus]